MYNVIQSSLQLTFAGLNALRPRVIEVRVTGTSALLKPSTTATTAIALAGFRDDATLGTYRCGGDGHHRALCFGMQT